MEAYADYILDGIIDTINVAPGIYMEDVNIRTPLSLVGAGRGQSIINAIGLSNGIYIDGLENPGLSKVVVTGFTIENANFEGILVTNASFVTIWDNEVINNDRNLNLSVPLGTGLPGFETNEDFDCGEGIHLIGVDHSTVVNNISGKPGGILLSDETSATHHNLIIGNLLRDNPFDCGITLASHSPLPSFSSNFAFGVIRTQSPRTSRLAMGFRSQEPVRELAFLHPDPAIRYTPT